MAAPSRLFLRPSGGTPGITPTPATEWEFTTGFARVVPSLTKTNTAPANKQVIDATATANRDALFYQFVFPLVTGTEFLTSHTFKGQVLASEAATGNNLRGQAIVRVMASDGSTVRATLYAGDLTTGTSNPTAEWGTGFGNREILSAMPVACAANYTTVAGDYLVIEIGYRKHAAASTTGNIRLMDNQATDLTDGANSGAGDFNTWIEFSGNLEGEVAKSADDSQVISQTEATSQDISSTVADTQAISQSEAAEFAITEAQSADDAQALSQTEATSQDIASTTDDTQAVSQSEATSVDASSAAVDTQALSQSENVSVEIVETKSADDAQTIGQSETISIVVTFTAPDTAAISGPESVEIAAQTSGADSQALSATEAAFASVPVVAVDTQAISQTESVAKAENQEIGAVETAFIDEDTDGVGISTSRTMADAQALGRIETTLAQNIKNAADTQALTGTEGTSRAVTLALSEARALSSIDGFLIDVTLSVGDASALSAGEGVSAGEDRPIFASDVGVLGSISATVIGATLGSADVSTIGSSDVASFVVHALYADTQSIILGERVRIIDDLVPSGVSVPTTGGGGTGGSGSGSAGIPVSSRGSFVGGMGMGNPTTKVEGS